MLLAEIMTEAGVPPGVVNVVNGIGEQAGRLLTEHPAIRATAFIGESRTGSLRSIHDEFVERVAARVARIKVGHPLDPATEVGPLVHSRHLDKVLSYFEIARKEGVQARAGGKREARLEPGYYVQPTLFTGAKTTHRIAQEEVFGPVLTAISFEDEAEALSVANDVQYGLTAYIWTESVGRALRMAHNVEAGMVWVNSENNRHLPTPFGGMKASGIGRDGGDYSFDFYMETKNICLAHGTHKVPKLGA
jgi:5-carboxymethyl-2-hydroxymuconic-semialdehyde dehydrogenase